MNYHDVFHSQRVGWKFDVIVLEVGFVGIRVGHATDLPIVVDTVVGTMAEGSPPPIWDIETHAGNVAIFS